MLVGLAIRNVVLIDRLDLTFDSGLSVLTGETGAGKSILLDALGLSLGLRADSGLLRPGADQASVTAAFEPPLDHEAYTLLAEQGLDIETGEPLVLRRVLGKDGRSRAFCNDQPVSVGLLRMLGEGLVEIQGQFEQRGLLDSARHRALLDAHAGLQREVDAIGDLWRVWRAAMTAHQQAASDMDKARADESYLRHALEELEGLNPQPGEEARLAEERAFLMNGEKLIEALSAVAGTLSGDGTSRGMAQSLGAVRRSLERLAETAGGRLDDLLQTLDRAAAELSEAETQVAALSADLDLEPGRLNEIEERFFALKDLARKHGCDVEQLPELRRAFSEKLAGIEHADERLAALAREAEAARAAYWQAARALSNRRRDAAARFDAAVEAELVPLRLDKARFVTRIEPQDEAAWGPTGIDRVAFEVATNPGSEPAPLAKVASGGELSRFLLALKVVLAEVSDVPTLVFDEVDSGVGGATAAAVGERLDRLAESRQVLVVTHSPQVAARGRYHLQVRKESSDEAVLTRVSRLDAAARREEVARMLSGVEVTDEARAAAEKLMGAV